MPIVLVMFTTSQIAEKGKSERFLRSAWKGQAPGGWTLSAAAAKMPAVARRQPYIPQPSIPEPRAFLLAEVLAFVRAASTCAGVRRIALVGSLTTDKPIPKDADVLVTLDEGLDLAQLAPIARRLKGRCGSINSGADIFLCETTGRYIGRVCGYRECHPRAACEAVHCGFRDQRNHLNDDLHLVTLSQDLIQHPPLVLWPVVERRGVVPADVEAILAGVLERGSR